MWPPHYDYNDHLVGANELAGDEQADGYSSTCEEQDTQPGSVSAHISLSICDTNWLWKYIICAAAGLSSGFVCLLLHGDGSSSSLPIHSPWAVSGGLQAVLDVRFGCQGCLSGSVV